MTRRGLPTHAYHGSGGACPCHARLHHSFHSPAESAGGEMAGEARGHPAPRQGALQAPWNPLLKSYIEDKEEQR